MNIQATAEEIQQLRESFYEVLNNGDMKDKFDNRDIERFKKDDSWVSRYVIHTERDLKQSLNVVVESFTWRKEFNVFDIDSQVRMDLVIQGHFFPHGRDKEGSKLLIFKCKKYVKNTYPFDDLKKCIVYWFERLEREDKGKPISVFFDMESCGLANFDMELMKYLISLFKQYYPFFLNKIFIFEMPWVLNAAFKIIKALLPEKAAQLIKFLTRKDIAEYVSLDQALTCWGGRDDYVFSFVPETQENATGNMETSNATNKKVHFADGSPMSESASNSSDKDEKNTERDCLAITPAVNIVFTRDGNEMIGTLELENTDKHAIVSYKLRTTSPEKFIVKPNVGCLQPGCKVIIKVILVSGYQLNGLSKDKFLLMSTIINNDEGKSSMSEFWKNIGNKKVNQHRLVCVPPSDFNKNNHVATVEGSSESVQNNYNQLSSSIDQLIECQRDLQRSIKYTQYLQLGTMLLTVILGVLLMYVVRMETQRFLDNSYCREP